MFRRFMIVCWVLFATCFVAAAVGWAGESYFTSNLQSLRSANMIDQAIDKPKLIRDKLRSIAIGYELVLEWRRVSPEPRSALDEILELENDNAGYASRYSDLDDSELELRLAFAQETVQSADQYYESIDSFKIAKWIGSILAMIVLIWNFIWHTAHWVWMGREHSR